MRYVVNSSNHVVAVSFGADMVFADCVCTEYTGSVPSGWNSLQEWYADEGEKLWRWKVVSGNLTLDSSAVAPEEGRWGVPDLQTKTVTPKAKTQYVVSDEDFDGLALVKVMGDADLVPENIKSGVNIFGVDGSFAGNGGKFVQLTTTGESAFRFLVLDGLGREDNAAPKGIIGFCAHNSFGIQSFSILKTSTNDYETHAYLNGQLWVDTGTAVACLNGDICISMNIGDFPAGVYTITAMAYWE